MISASMFLAYLAVIFSALLVSALTLFSGFGLGTLLMPVFALFFPVEAAIAATGVVHLSNNLLKVFLLGRWASYRVVIRFALPAAIAATVGALALSLLSGAAPLYEYSLGARTCSVTTMKIVVALLILVFAVKKYYEVPGELLDEPDEFLEWAEESIAVARKAKKK